MSEIYFFIKNGDLYYQSIDNSIKLLSKYKRNNNIDNNNKIALIGGSTTYGLYLMELDDPAKILSKNPSNYELDNKITYHNYGYPGAHLSLLISDLNKTSELIIPIDKYLCGFSTKYNDQYLFLNSYKKIILAPIINDTLPLLINGVKCDYKIALIKMLNNISGFNLFKKEFTAQYVYQRYEELLQKYILELRKHSPNSEIILLYWPQYLNKDEASINMANKYFSFGNNSIDLINKLGYSMYSDIMDKEISILTKIANNSNIKFLNYKNYFDMIDPQERLEFFFDPIHMKKNGYEILSSNIIRDINKHNMYK